MCDHSWKTGNNTANTFWVVKLGPRIVNAVDLISDEFSSKDAMCKPIATVAGHDVGMLFALVEANKGDEIDGFEDLARPLVIDLATIYQ